MGFRSHLCVWAGLASHGRLRDGRALLALIDRIYIGYSVWYSFGILHFEVLQRPQYDCKQFEFSGTDCRVEDEAGDVIYWSITRQMYHIREKCSIYKATSMGRTARSCSVCKVCRPEIGVPVTVSSTGSKYHRRDCHTVSKSTLLVLVRCPICFDIKAE